MLHQSATKVFIRSREHGLSFQPFTTLLCGHTSHLQPASVGLCTRAAPIGCVVVPFLRDGAHVVKWRHRLGPQARLWGDMHLRLEVHHRFESCPHKKPFSV